MSILITGSSGVIGSALCKNFTASGTEVISFDIKQGFDICNKEHLLSAMDNKIDGVIHCAAVSRVCDCESNTALCRETNIIGTRNIVECLQKQVNKPWLLFLSSREVYGQAKEFPVTENFPYNPINEYAHSKVEGEKIVREYHNSGIVRLANVYGAANDYETRVIPAFTKAALSNEPLFLNGANNILDFIHIKDAVNGIFMYCRKKPIETIHLASGLPITLRQLAEKIIHFVNSKSQIVEKTAKDNEVSCFCGSPSMAKKILNWQAEISLEYGIETFIKETRK